ncbi:putative ubiquinone biosynthesis monooxygenase [Cryptotrichosporon argae]
MKPSSLPARFTSRSRPRTAAALAPCAVYIAPAPRRPVLALPLPPSTSSCSIPRHARAHSHAAPAPAPEPMPEISMEDMYDITIVGAGPAGLALACGIQQEPALRHARVLLLEGGSLDRVRAWDDAGEWSNRVSSLTADNVGWLARLGADAHLAKARSWPIHDMIIWTAPSSSSSSSSSASSPSLHFPPLDHPIAYMTENVNLQRALLRRLESGARGEGDDGGVRIMEGARVAEMRMGEGGGSVGLHVGGRWIRSRLVIGADGPSSPVRQFAQIATVGHAYPTHAVVATLLHARPLPYTNATAFQRFLPTGPLAFLPLSETASTMVWSTTPALAAAYRRLPPDALARVVDVGFAAPEPALASLNRAVLAADEAGAPLSAFAVDALVPPPAVSVSAEAAPSPPPILSIPASSVAGFPLRLAHAETYVAPRLALVGDAAHTTHPLAGQGLNLGLADARALAAVLASAAATGADLGALTALAPYVRARWAANHKMLLAVDTLDWVFKARAPGLDWARATALEVINELEGVKHMFMRSAGSGAHAEWDRTYARARADESSRPQPTGWPARAADALDGWIKLKGVLGLAGEVVGAGLKNGLQRAAGALERK